MADSGTILPDEHTVAPLMGAWNTLKSMDFMAIEIQMIVSAVFIIYVGAHASLRRPPSAAPPVKKRKKGGKADVEQKEEFAPGFEASDAILFPLIAATVLIGLYYLIKWLQDPAILNKILRWYMAMTGVFSTGFFLGNALQVAVGFACPDYWADGKGRIFRIDARSRSQQLVRLPGAKDVEVLHEPDSKNGAPFPGLASGLPVSPRMRDRLYSLRHLLVQDWNLEIDLWGLGRERSAFKLTTLIGCALGLGVQGLYLYTSNPMLANVIGLAVSYMACQYMSVTSFNIGSLVLVGLFVYDIIMVFYTPFMVGVATQLDVPIKLTYQTAKRSSMLGLGDVVVPGIFICLALRFDLWRHYQRKITREKTDLKTVSKENVAGKDSEDVAATKEVTTVDTAYRDVKAPFVDPRGQWGNVFWTTSWQDLFSGQSAVPSIAESTFSKTYFHATILGYLLGMLITISILIIFRHGQPALLYLVPGVVGSAYLTGWWRGELADMLMYTENGSLDTEDVVVEVDGNGNVIPKSTGPKEKAGDVQKVQGTDEANAEEKKKNKDENAHKQDDDSYEVLRFSITVPREEDDLKED